MTDDRNIKQPQDHLPPASEHDDGRDASESPYPGAGAPDGGSPVTPATQSEPERPERHGLDGTPQRDR